MTPAEIEARLHGLDTRPMKQTEIDRFISAGVPPRALVDPDMIVPAVVYPYGDGRYGFRDELRDPPDGVKAFLIACRDESGEVVDLAAWRPADGWLAVWCGQSWGLGADLFPHPLDVLHEDGAVRVFAEPMAWLRCDRRGIVVVNWQRARRPLLDAAGPYIAEDFSLARRLRSLLTVQAPRILVPSIAQVAA